jgi:RimJ/RimL family protein N-acetyltransferase
MLCYDLDRVFACVHSIMPSLHRADNMQAVGWEADGRVIAGAIFEGYNGRNMWAHIAGSEEDTRWQNRRFLKAGFVYAFNIARVDRLSGYVYEGNERARRLDEHLGFKEETRLKGAAPDGRDVIIYCMRREDCRYV